MIFNVERGIERLGGVGSDEVRVEEDGEGESEECLGEDNVVTSTVCDF